MHLPDAWAEARSRSLRFGREDRFVGEIEEQQIPCGDDNKKGKGNNNDKGEGNDMKQQHDKSRTDAVYAFANTNRSAACSAQ
jgi:hypothetical protein